MAGTAYFVGGVCSEHQLPAVRSARSRCERAGPQVCAERARVLADLWAGSSRRVAEVRVSPAQRLVVDAYMAQHPGDGRDRRDRQSVFVHLAGLCAVLDFEIEPDHATDVLRRVLETRTDFRCSRVSTVRVS